MKGSFIYFGDFKGNIRKTWYYEKIKDNEFHAVNIKLSLDDLYGNLNSKITARKNAIDKFNKMNLLIAKNPIQCLQSLIKRGKFFIFNNEDIQKLKDKAFNHNASIRYIKEEMKHYCYKNECHLTK